MNAQFSFLDFEGEILSLMNVAPIQLHPNSWAFLRAFQILCKSLKIEPTVNKFMYFYQLKMGVKVGWASLNAYKFRIFFCCTVNLGKISSLIFSKFILTLLLET